LGITKDDGLSGIVRLSELDGWIGNEILKKIHADPQHAGDLDGNRLHWLAGIEPPNVHPDGGFFFRQHVTGNSLSVKLALQEAVTEGTAKAKEPLNFVDGLKSLKGETEPVIGIDVSHFNGDVDWESIPKNRVKFAFIKVTQGGVYFDSNFTKNFEGAARAGIKIGVYHFYNFCDDVRSQFANFAHALSKVTFDKDPTPISLDVELWPDQAGSNIPSLAREASCALHSGNDKIRSDIKFISDLIRSKYGVKPILYGNDYLLDQVLGEETIKQFTVWRSKLGLYKGPPKQPWDIWQYSINERVNGVKGTVDMNIVNGPGITALLNQGPQ
jgi:lysozyme